MIGKIKQKVISLLYFGWRYHCPICGGNFRDWRMCGMVRRRRGKCPQCNCVERHRLIYLYLKNKTRFFQDALKVLHVAPEACFHKRFAALPNLSYTTADLDSPLAHILLDVTDMKKISDKTYDVVLCSHVLEHVSDDRKAMREICRILKPGGWAILQVPIFEGNTFEDPAIVTAEERIKHYGQEDHRRRYGLDYKDRLAAAGFDVSVDTYVKTLGKKAVEKYGLDNSEDIYLCTKKS